MQALFSVPLLTLRKFHLTLNQLQWDLTWGEDKIEKLQAQAQKEVEE